MSAVVYLLNGVDGNSLTQGLAYSGRLLKFGIGGKFIGETPMSYNFSRQREVDLVSIINVENELEVAYIKNNVFKKFTVYADVFDIIKWCNIHPNLIFVGKRDCVYSDYKGNIEYSQYFFGFKAGSLNEEKLQEVMKVNG